MSRLSDAKEKYPNLDWDKLVKFDPSNNYKYLDWLGKNHAKMANNALKELIVQFEKRKDSLSNKDIYKYSATDLKAELEKLGPSNSEQKEMGITEVKDERIPKGFKLICLETPAAAKKYCAGTKWCISDPSTFIEYAQQGNIYILLFNKRKLALIDDSGYFIAYTEEDDEMGDDSVEMIMEFIAPEFPIFDVLKKHSNSYDNIWLADGGEFDLKDKKFLDKLATHLSKDDYKDIFTKCGAALTKEVFDVLNSNKEKYANIINFFKTSRSLFSEYDHVKYQWKNVMFCTRWKELENPPSPKKPKAKSTTELFDEFKNSSPLTKIKEMDEKTKKAFRKILMDSLGYTNNNAS